MKPSTSGLTEFTIVLALLAGIFSLSVIGKINVYEHFETPLSFDPYMYLPRSEALLETGEIPQLNPYVVGSTRDALQPLIIVITSVISTVFQIPLIRVYVYFGIIITSFASVAFYLLARKYLRFDAAVFATLLFSASPYLLSRGLLTIAESFSFLLTVTVYYLTIEFANRRSIRVLLWLSLLLIALYYTHSSFFLVLFSILLYGIYFAVTHRMLHRGSIIILVIFGSIIFFWGNIQAQLLYYLINNYNPTFPNIGLYLRELGHSLVMLSLFGALALSFKQESIHRSQGVFIVILLLVSLAFSLIVSPEFNIRILFYLAIPLAVLGGFGYQAFLNLFRHRFHKALACLALLTTVLPLKPNYVYENFHTISEIRLATWLKQNTPDNARLFAPAVSASLIGSLSRRQTEINHDIFRLKGKTLERYLQQYRRNESPVFVVGSWQPHTVAINIGYQREYAERYTASVTRETVNYLESLTFFKTVYSSGDAFALQLTEEP